MNHAESVAGRPVRDLLLLLKRVLYELKAKGCTLVSIYFGNTQLVIQ